MIYVYRPADRWIRTVTTLVVTVAPLDVDVMVVMTGGADLVKVPWIVDVEILWFDQPTPVNVQCRSNTHTM